MQLVMRSTPKHRRFFAFQLGYSQGPVIDPEFDDENRQPITAEPLDWHLCRQYPHPQLT